MLVKKQVNNVGKTENFRYKDENDFVKKLHSLKTYCPRSYKDLIFNTNLKYYLNPVMEFTQKSYLRMIYLNLFMDRLN